MVMYQNLVYHPSIHPAIHPSVLHYFRLVSDPKHGWMEGGSTPGWVREDWFQKCLHSFWFCLLGLIYALGKCTLSFRVYMP